jgi:putative transcriptional regulator
MLQAGEHIRATAALRGDYFESASILIVKHDVEGSIGFIMRRPSGRFLNELMEFRDCPAIPLWEGGPVGSDHLYLLHQRPDLISGGTRISPGQYWGGSMDELVEALHAHTIQEDHFSLCLGYSGWDAGELEQEIAEGSWELVQQ